MAEAKPETVGQLLRMSRTESGKTQKWVACTLGVSANTVRCWELDTHPVPTRYVRTLARLLGFQEYELTALAERASA